MTTDQKTLQRTTALAKANAIRLEVGDLKAEVRRGYTSLAEALTDPRADPIPVDRLLTCRRGMGAKQANEILGRLHVRGFRVRDLPPGKLKAVREAVS